MNSISLQILCLFVSSSLLIPGCGGSRSPEIIADVDGCAICNMTISKLNQACGLYEENEFHTFCSPGCLLRRFDESRRNTGQVPREMYVADYVSARLTPVDSVVFLLTSHIPTVMGANVICFRERADAEAAMKHADEQITNWIGYWTERGTPDRRVDVVATDSALIPATLEFRKGDLVEWSFRGEGLEDDLVLRLRGYEEFGEILILRSGERTLRRLIVDKPGAGFPIERVADGAALGMVKVSGAHTEDEEQM